MAGLVAAARLRELGAEVVVLEKGDRAGGSMLLSSGVIWRFRTVDDFRRECPGGDARLQALVVERLDDALEWLESLGTIVVDRDTGNERTIGMRFDTRALTDALARAARDIRLRTPFAGGEPLVLATGGFHVRLAREHGLLVRGNPWSEGDALDFALARGAATYGALDEFYGRAMPALERIGEEDFVRLAQVYGRFATVTSDDGTRRFEGEPSWSENDLVQEIARWPGGRAWFSVRREDLGRKVRDRTVAGLIEDARAVGATVAEEADAVRVLVRAAVTHTIGGLRIDPRARLLGEDGSPIDGVYAAGADAGGISTGGYSSGLASALVLGLVAAENVAA